jgi:hypothetical protein
VNGDDARHRCTAGRCSGNNAAALPPNRTVGADQQFGARLGVTTHVNRVTSGPERNSRVGLRKRGSLPELTIPDVPVGARAPDMARNGRYGCSITRAGNPIADSLLGMPLPVGVDSAAGHEGDDDVGGVAVEVLLAPGPWRQGRHDERGSQHVRVASAEPGTLPDL